MLLLVFTVWMTVTTMLLLSILESTSVGAYAQQQFKMSKNGQVLSSEPIDTPQLEELSSSSCMSEVYPLKEVKNFRDIASASQTHRIKSGKIYRTGSVSRANEEDIFFLRQVLDLNTFIDLRSQQELEEDAALNSSGIYSNLSDWKYREGSFLPLPSRETTPSSLTGKERYFLSLLDEQLLVKALLKRLPPLLKLKALVLLPFSFISRRAKQALRLFFLQRINEGGLFLLNELILDIAGPEIAAVLKLLAEESRYPIAFYCTAGKDRTGIISMLLLSILDLSDEEIREDYQISDSVYRDLDDHQAVVASLQQSDVDPSIFLRATPEIIQHALDYLRQKYGSVDGYLDAQGVSASWRQRLREALLK